MKDAKYIFVYKPDEFRPIFLPEPDPVAPYYLISRYGAIYSLCSGDYILQTQNTKGYMVVSLQTISGARIQRRVHRLVKYTFDYFPGCEELQIDHINGVKNDNRIENLDWVTGKENARRRNLNGFVPGRIFSDEEIMNICNLVIEGFSDEQISYIVPGANRMRIAEMIEGRAATHIITPEMLQAMRDKRREISRAKSCTVLSDEMKHTICKFFQDNPLPHNTDMEKRALINLTLDSLHIENTPSNRRLVRRLLIRETNESITSLYNY